MYTYVYKYIYIYIYMYIHTYIYIHILKVGEVPTDGPQALHLKGGRVCGKECALLWGGGSHALRGGAWKRKGMREQIMPNKPGGL